MQRVRHYVDLSDGRKLAYAMFGATLQQQPQQYASAPAAGSHPIMYHHGWPSSCVEGVLWHEAAAELGLSLISVDRPGIGGSTIDSRGSFQTYASNIQQLLNHLGLKSVIHIGTSGGGPYACACAAAYPKTAAGLCLVASMTHCSGPGSADLMRAMDWSNRVGYNLIAYAPWFTRMSLAVAAPYMAAVSAVVQMFESSSSRGMSAVDASAAAVGGDATSSKSMPTQRGMLPQLARSAGRGFGHLVGAFFPRPDRQVLLEQLGLFLQLAPQILGDSVSQGSKGLFADMRLTTLPWDIDLGQVQAPTLVFQGTADINVTVAMAEYFSKHILGAELHLIEGASHFSLVAKHSRQILGHLVPRVEER